MSSTSPIDLIARFSKPSLCLSSGELPVISKLAEVIKRFLRVQCVKLVESCRTEPLAEILTQDATPLRTCTVHSSGAGALAVRRRGRRVHEWLVQRLFLLSHSGQRCALFTDPRDMEDKTCATHHAAGVELWEGARLHGHVGLLISHGVWDRAVCAPCHRMLLQRHEALRIHQRSTDDSADWLSLWHWTTAAGCAAHDFSNSLRWAHLHEFSSRDTMRRMWIVVESLRSSLDQLLSNLPAWVSSKLQFRDYVGEASLREVWRLLGFSAGFCDEFADLQLRFEDDALLVAERHREDPGLADRIANCFMYMFEFRGWSDTRWCAVGRICRRLLACQLCGLASLVKFIKSRPKESTYYIAGYQNLDESLMCMVVTCACSASISEVPLRMVLEDDRLPRLLPHLDAAVATERDIILGRAVSTYEFLGHACGLSGKSILHRVSQAVLVQLGYAARRLRTCRELPWSLVGGDVSSKLQRLKESPEPTHDSVSWKIHRLLHAGVDEARIIAGVELMEQLPHTSRCAEQAHVLSSMLMKSHKQYTAETMTARTVVCAAKQLAAGEVDSTVRRLDKVRLRLATLRRKQPSKIGARQAFVSQKLRQKRLESARRDGYRQSDGRQVVRAHGVAWRGLTSLQKRGLAEVARRLRSRRVAETRRCINEGIANLRRLRAEVATRVKRACNHLRFCVLPGAKPKAAVSAPGLAKSDPARKKRCP